MTEHNRAHVPETGWDDVLQRCDLTYKIASELALGIQNTPGGR